MTNEFFSWEYLLTFAGAMVATGVLTQFLKDVVDKLLHIPTQLLAYLIALTVLMLASWFTGVLTLSGAVLNLFNAALIATAASGTVDSFRRFVK